MAFQLSFAVPSSFVETYTPKVIFKLYIMRSSYGMAVQCSFRSFRFAEGLVRVIREPQSDFEAFRKPKLE